MAVHSWDAIIAGAGLGGLTAAALLAKDGHRVLVLDRNRAPGGAATTYARAGRRFEVSLHETTAPDAPGDPKGPIFAALGLMDRLEFVPVPAFQEVRGPLFGRPVTIPHGLAAVEAALVDRFPDRAEALRGFLRQVGLTQDAIAALSQRHSGRWWLGHATELPAQLHALARDMGHSLSTVMDRYFGQDEALKLLLAANLPYYADDPDRFWWMGYAVAQGGFLAHGGHYLKGGSSALSRALAEIVLENGGEIALQSDVTRFLVRDGAVSGVEWRTEDGIAKTALSDVVLAGIAPQAVAERLPGSVRAKFEAAFADRRLSISLFEITFALTTPGRDLGLRSYSTVLLPDWMTRLRDFAQAGQIMGTRPGTRLPPMVVVDYGQIDSGLSDRLPPPISVTGIDHLDNWNGLSETAYAKRKQAWVEAITARLDQEWPGFAASVMRADMATARTMQSWLGTPGGAVYGFAPDVPQKPFGGPPLRVETSVKGLLLASSFAGFGGYSGAMGAGMQAARAASGLMAAPG